MSNRKILVLITSEDPLWGAASFVKNELDACFSLYDQIYVFSEFRKNKNPFRYKPNCNIYGLKMNLAFKYVYFAFKGLFYKKSILRDCEKPGTVKRKFFQLYERGKSIYMFKKIKNTLSSIVKKDDRVIFLSYWLLNTATSAILLSNYYRGIGMMAKCVSRAHGYDVYSERNKLNYLPFQLYNVASLDQVFPCSDNGTKYLQEKYVNYKDKISTSRLGTKDYGIENFEKTDITHFVTCSNLIPLKRIDLFAEAFAKLVKSKNVFWTCIGDGPDKEKIMDILVKNNVPPDKYKICGSIKNEDIMNLYLTSNIDYFVNISIYEGVPVTIMESMSFGIPIIATSVGGTPEIVNNDNGILISKELNGDKLAQILVGSIENYNISKRISARKSWEKLCDSNKQIRDLHFLLLTI